MNTRTQFSSPTLDQMGKVLTFFKGVAVDRLQDWGFPLLSLLVEYLRQENPKKLNLLTMRQALGLPLRGEQIWATVDWLMRKKILKDGQAIIGRSAKQQRTQLIRLWPEDLGLTQAHSADQVIGRALEWGYQVVPAPAIDVLVQHGNATAVPGWIWVPLEDCDYAFLEMKTSDRRVYRRDPTRREGTDYPWSVVMAY